MRDYEIMIILKPALDEEAVGEFLERVSTLIANHGGSIDKVDKWGKRRFSYEIDDLREGIYFVIDFCGTPQTTSELSRVLKLTDSVIRHMIVSREQQQRIEEPQQEEQQPEPEQSQSDLLEQPAESHDEQAEQQQGQ